MKLIPNFIRNTDEIVRVCDQNYHLFKPREGSDAHESLIPGVLSKFKTWKNDSMSDEFIDLIFKYSDFDPTLRDFYSFIQIHRYDPVDFIIPHKDVYEITKLHLISLTNSEVDGLVCQVGNSIEKVYDEAGQYIDFPYDAYHWVDPVKHRRYSLVLGE
jgi:hypothetical protein